MYYNCESDAVALQARSDVTSHRVAVMTLDWWLRAISTLLTAFSNGGSAFAAGDATVYQGVKVLVFVGSICLFIVQVLQVGWPRIAALRVRWGRPTQAQTTVGQSSGTRKQEAQHVGDQPGLMPGTVLEDLEMLQPATR